MSKLNVLLRHVHTHKDLQAIQASIDAIMCIAHFCSCFLSYNLCNSADQEEANRPAIVPFLIVKMKGQPCQKRLRAAINKYLSSHKRIQLSKGKAVAEDIPDSLNKPDTAAIVPTKSKGRGMCQCGNCQAVGHYATTCKRAQVSKNAKTCRD
jgi:hypothetical protein